MNFLFYNFNLNINFKDGILVNKKPLKFNSKRKIFSDRHRNYTMIEIFNSDDIIKDCLVYDESINYKYLLYQEVICLNFKKIKFNKSSIIGFNQKK